MNDRDMVPLSVSLTAGAFSYEQFLNLAIPLTEMIARRHSTGKAHGQLGTTVILYDGAGHVELPPPQPTTATCDDDLIALGRIFHHALTGKPVEEKPDTIALRRIYPVEARLTLEKLLGLHVSGQFASVTELHASLVLMKDVFDLSERDQPARERPGSARVYLALSLIVLILVIVWVIMSILRK
jgi:hypothetical protein